MNPATPKYYHPDSDYFRKTLNAPIPTAESHEVVDTFENPLSDRLSQLLPNSWRLEGNELIGQTELGELRQRISTDYVLVSTDAKGLPVFKKVLLSK